MRRDLGVTLAMMHARMRQPQRLRARRSNHPEQFVGITNWAEHDSLVARPRGCKSFFAFIINTFACQLDRIKD